MSADANTTGAPPLRIEDLEVGDKVDYRYPGNGDKGWTTTTVERVYTRSMAAEPVVTIDNGWRVVGQPAIDEGRLRRTVEPVATQDVSIQVNRGYGWEITVPTDHLAKVELELVAVKRHLEIEMDINRTNHEFIQRLWDIANPRRSFGERLEDTFKRLADAYPISVNEHGELDDLRAFRDGVSAAGAALFSKRGGK